MKIRQYICALLIAGAALHTPIHAADLMETYRQALEEDALYSAARAAHMAAQERLPQGRAGLLPTLSLAFVKRRQFIDIGNVSSIVPVGTVGTVRPSEVTIDNQSLTITATQPIYPQGKFRNL